MKKKGHYYFWTEIEFLILAFYFSNFSLLFKILPLISKVGKNKLVIYLLTLDILQFDIVSIKGL